MTTIRISGGRVAVGTLLWVALFVIPLSSCTRQEGRTISEATVMTLKVGKTTEKDVLQKLGPPETKKRVLGEEVWVYSHVVNKGFADVSTDVHTLRLRFDERGILQNIDEKNQRYQTLF